MHRIGLETLSTFGLDPVALVHLAADLGCGHVSLNLRGVANRLPQYPEFSLANDSALRRAVATACRERSVSVALVEGFVVAPDFDVADHAAALDCVGEFGGKAICAVSLDRDLARTHDQFARLTELAGGCGLVTTTELGAGVMRNLGRALDAVAAVADPRFRLLVDTMHFFRSGSTLADFAALDPAAIGHVQLCDVPMPAVIDSYMEEALWERRCPGDGDLPLADFLSLVPNHAVIGLEVPMRSEAEAGLSAHERLGRCVAAARELLRLHG